MTLLTHFYIKKHASAGTFEKLNITDKLIRCKTYEVHAHCSALHLVADTEA